MFNTPAVALIQAIESNNLLLAKEVFESGFSTTEKIEVFFERSPSKTYEIFNYALECFSTDLFELLISFKCTLNSKIINNLADLMKTTEVYEGLVRNLTIENLNYYIQNGGEIEFSPDKKGLLGHAIHQCSQRGRNSTVLETLINLGIDLNSPKCLFPNETSKLCAPYISALRWANIALAQRFLDLKVLVNPSNDLNFSIEQNFSIRSIIFLFRQGFKSERYPSLQSFFNGPIDISALDDDIEIISEFIDNGGDINKKFKCGYGCDTTLLHHAAFKDNIQMIEFLITHRAAVNTLDLDGKTALDIIAYKGNKTIEVLKKHGALRSAKLNV